MSIKLDHVKERIPIEAFWAECKIDVKEIVDGLVHKTYLVEVANERFILQRINTFVFKEADKVLSNIQKVTAHLDHSEDYRLLVPLLKPSITGHLSHVAADGSLWRCFHFIDGTTKSRLANSLEAFEVARAFGQFSAALTSLPAASLHFTIEGFHDPDLRESQFREALRNGVSERIAQCRPEIAKIEKYQYLGRMMASLELPLKVVHNDPKLSNVLFNTDGHPISIIDLDTVMPGSPLHDFGDLVRSMAASVAEDHEELSAVFLNTEIYQVLNQGFREGASKTLTDLESQHLKSGAAYIIYEQAMRFLTDYLNGDIYYRVKSSQHNLTRARNQITLLESF
ncbi:MAG: aminoglycoside phosphotransferase family protein [Saprospiraceae bacterium]|nr:aminoglycoside phosphotransferase family protein [Saprospiraceae bacterium]